MKTPPNSIALFFSVACAVAFGHESHWTPSHPGGTSTKTSKLVPSTAKAFVPFENEIGISWDDKHVHIESDGLPSHNMMTGITAWQQQVPIPHNFTGPQAFKIPLKPEYREEPGELTLMGPLAVAVNGIPIFHALTQSGKDAYAGGELDQWGGHCGRADDYHYHIAPAHLEAVVGKGNPVAYALDGYPIHIADPATDKPLDACHGYMDDDGNYRYVGTLKPPYVMSGFRGKADLDTRPRTQPVRPHLPPLRGAKITRYEGLPATGATLTYELRGQTNTVRYVVDEAAQSMTMTFGDAKGRTRTETHERRERAGRADERGKGEKRGKGRKPRGERQLGK